MQGSHIRPTGLSHARKKSWLIVSTMAPCALSHRTTNHSPQLALLLRVAPGRLLHVAHVMRLRVHAATYDTQQRNALLDESRKYTTSYQI